MNKMTQSEHERHMQLLRSDFKNFLYVIWKHLQLPAPTPVQYDIADYIQYGPKRRMVEAFRGVGKSWVTSAYVLWRLFKDPQEKILVVSASSGRADAFSMFTKRLISEVAILKHLEPKSDQRSSNIAFDVGPARAAHAPSVKSVGIFGQMAGSRATLIISDDVEIPSNSATEDAREKLINATNEFNALIMPDVGEILVLGTPQSEESIYNKLPDKGYDIRIWPARYPVMNKLDSYKGHLAPMVYEPILVNQSLCGKPTDPKRFHDVDLIERELSYGKAGFALQFQLDTSLSDAEKYPLKHSNLIVMPLSTHKGPINVSWGSSKQIKSISTIGFTGDRWYEPFYVDKEYTEYEGSVMTIDPSGRGNDLTSYAVVKQLHGYLYVLDCGGFPGGYEDDTLDKLAKIAKDHKVNSVLIESNFGDGMFQKMLIPVLGAVGHPCKIEELRTHTQKEVRIADTLEPVMGRHRLVVDQSLVERDVKEALASENPKHSLFYQMTRLTRDRGSLKHDDKLDALAMAVGYWTNSMARDTEDAKSTYEQMLLDKELEEFMDMQSGFGGSKIKRKPAINPDGGLKWSKVS